MAKGSGALSALHGIRSVSKPEQFERMVAALTPAARDIVKQPPLPVAWIPAEPVADIIHTGHRVALEGRDELLMEAASIAIKSDLNTLYKLFIRLASPQWVIDRASKLYDTYTRDNGSLTSKRINATSTDVRYSGVVVISPSHWVYQQGAIIGVLQATGLKHPKVKLVAGGGATHDATFIASWDPTPEAEQ